MLGLIVAQVLTPSRPTDRHQVNIGRLDRTEERRITVVGSVDRRARPPNAASSRIRDQAAWPDQDFRDANRRRAVWIYS